MRAKILAIIAAFACALAARAANFFPETFRARFSEERTRMVTGERVSHAGTIEYRYPGRLRLEVEGPVKTVLVVGTERTWHYTAPFIEGEKGELKVSPNAAKAASPGRIFDLMKHGLATNEHYAVARSGGDFVLTPNKKTAEDFRVDRLRLSFKGAAVFKNLERMEVVREGRSTVYVFKNIESDVTLAPSRFQFEAPANTNVTSF